MIHGIDRTSGLFDEGVTDEINCAFSEVNDKIENYEQPKTNKHLDVFYLDFGPVDNTAVAIKANNSIYTKDWVQINIEVQFKRALTADIYQLLKCFLSTESSAYVRFCNSSGNITGNAEVSGNIVQANLPDVSSGDVIYLQGWWLR